jgi:IS30 family transposase
MTTVGTPVERHGRYLILLKLPNGHGAQAVRQAMTKRILTLPAQLRRSITWNQGEEMAEHVQFTLDTGGQIYFCDPKSPWQRGSKREHQRACSANTSPSQPGPCSKSARDAE